MIWLAGGGGTWMQAPTNGTSRNSLTRRRLEIERHDVAADAHALAVELGDDARGQVAARLPALHRHEAALRAAAAAAGRRRCSAVEPEKNVLGFSGETACAGGMSCAHLSSSGGSAARAGARAAAPR